MSCSWEDCAPVASGKSAGSEFFAGTRRGGVLAAIAILMLITVLEMSCTSCEVSTAKTQGKTPSLDTPGVTNPETPIPQCGTLTASTGLPLDPPPIGEHRVILSWKASVPASTAIADAVAGYCIYRQEGNAAAGSLNKVPVNATSCSDNRVAIGKTYVYLVTGVSVRNKASQPAKVTTAAIPDKPVTGSIPPNTPSCWGDLTPN